MSKLSFRARALDATKAMPVFKAEEIPELPDFAAINRAVPQMPTGMEKEEETEHHLQRALSAQQVYGTAEALVIPIPEIEHVTQTYKHMYHIPDGDYKPPKQYIHVQPWGMDQDIPDYDMDSEDEQWLTKQAKNLKMEVTPLKFENMMDRLEKGSGQTVVTLHEAKALLKEDDDLTIAVYDYWLNKRLRLQHALIPQVKTEKRDGSTTNNPYVAFRRRTEKMQTRKNRKNDEASYEKMLKLRRDLKKALTILELMKRREKSKKELLQLTIEIVDKRYQMQDWDAKALAEALAQRHKLPAFIPIHNQFLNKDWIKQEEGVFPKKKREYRKRKHKQQSTVTAPPVQQPTVQLPQYTTEVDVLQPDAYSSDEEAFSPSLSPSDHELDDDPDGPYAFRRKVGCLYHAPINDGLGNWPWYGNEEGGLGHKPYRYSLGSLTQSTNCLGFVRRRIGRGGRPMLDRAFTPWDDYLSEMDMSNSPTGPGWMSEYCKYIKDNNISHFRPRTPTEDYSGSGANCHPAFRDSLSPMVAMEFNAESFHDHHEQLLQMQRQQQEQLLKQETDSSLIDLEHSFSSQPTSRFTLDSATAQFAASAVCNSAQDLVQTTANTATSATASNISAALPVPSATASLSSPTTVATTTVASSEFGANSTVMMSASLAGPLTVGNPVTSLTNGPLDCKSSGLSTSPAANVLQLNYPMPSASSQALGDIATPPPASTAPNLSAITSTASLTSASASAFLVSASSAVTTTTAAAAVAASSSGFSVPAVLNSAMQPAIATKLGNPASSLSSTSASSLSASSSPSPAVLKLSTGNQRSRNDGLPRESHEGVNSVVKDKIVAMEVT